MTFHMMNSYLLIENPAVNFTHGSLKVVAGNIVKERVVLFMTSSSVPEVSQMHDLK